MSSLDRSEPACLTGLLKMGQQGQRGRLGPGCRLPSSPPLVLAAPTLPFWPRPRPDTCSHTRACQAWPCSLQPWLCPPPRRHAPSRTHPGLRPSTHYPLVLFYRHSCTRSRAHHHARLETQTRPGPPPLWASSPLGPMNNSLLSLWASIIYPLRFPALSSLGEGPALAPPSLWPHPPRTRGHSVSV